ncbi:MAG: DUF3159 domain-containing protein [Dermatophilaceae bacterium]
MTAAHQSAQTVEVVIRARLAAALGGWRGSVETALPTVVFVVLWTWRRDVAVAAGVALGTAVVLAVLRLVQRSPLTHVLGAVFATAVAAFFALRSGRAEDAFLPGILLSAGFLVSSVLSIALRWPAVGFIVAAGDPDAVQDPFGWRRDRGMVRVCTRLTWVLVALYVIRLAVMAPLYLADEVVLLGTAKVALGWPLWVGALAVMGWLLMSGHTPVERAADVGSGDSTPAG